MHWPVVDLVQLDDAYNFRDYFTALQWRYMGVIAFQITCNSTVLLTLAIKKTPKPRVTGSFWWESNGDRWIALTKGQ